MRVEDKPTVSVLLSTYNGHKYIRELIDSVLAQQDVNVKLQIRDDGSTDDTVDIIKSYHDPRIKIFKGKNLKPAKSFLKLLRECDDSEYYAFCDQDDYWYPRKLITAINELKKEKKPTLFLSTYDVCDEKLNKLFTFNMKFEEPLRLQDVLLYRAPSACNMVFNHPLREEINKTNPNFVRMHDYWVLIVVLANDYKIITKDIPLIKYRQHSGEAFGIAPSTMTRIKRLSKSFREGKNERWLQAKEAYRTFNGQISKEKNNILRTLVYYRYSFKNRVALLYDKRYKTNNTYIDRLFFISVLLGKF